MVNIINQLMKIQNNIELINSIEKAKVEAGDRPIVFLCVGNSKIWYDSYGPMVGTLLRYLGFNYYIYGNLRSNVNLDNLSEFIEMIYKFHVNPFVIVFDSAISTGEEYDITAECKAMNCGALRGKGTMVGDFSVKFLIPAKDINCNNGYKDLLKAVKKTGMFMLHVFSEKSNKSCYF